jgi:hypothetical protein
MVSPVPDSIGFVFEDELLRVTKVARSTRQNWVRKHIIEDPDDGRYLQRDVLETAAVSQLAKGFKRLEDVRLVWAASRDEVLAAFVGLTAQDYLVLLVEERSLRATLGHSPGDLGQALRPFESAVAIPLAQALVEASEDFWRFAMFDSPRPDGRRREAQRQAREAGARNLKPGQQ